MRFSNTDMFSHPTSYYPEISVFSKGKVLLLEKEGSNPELAKTTQVPEKKIK